MITRDSLRKQLRGSIEVIIGTASVIIGVIAGVNLVADTIGDGILDIIRKYYGPRGLFNLGLPDIFWIILGLFIFSFTIKLAISIAMPLIIPFHGYCPRCGVKPLQNEESCSECGCSLYRKRISSFEVRMYLTVTTGLAIFLVIWYILVMIIGVRIGVDPGVY